LQSKLAVATRYPESERVRSRCANSQSWSTIIYTSSVKDTQSEAAMLRTHLTALE